MTDKSSQLFPSVTGHNNHLTPLFPTNPHTSETQATLFPSALPSGAPSTQNIPPQCSWLQNSSFPEHLVEKLNAVKKEGQSVQHGSSQHHPPKYDSKRSKTDKPSKKDKKKKKKHKKDHSEKSEELKFDLFELLCKGDKNNYKYGSLYAYDVPTYKTVIKHCIGEKLTASLKSQLRNPNNHDTSLRYYSKLKAPELSLHYSSKFLRLDADYISLTVSSQCWEPSEPVLAALDPSKSDPNSKEKWILFIDSTGRTKAGLERRYDICQKARKFLPNDIEILKKTIETARQYMSTEEIGRVWTDLLFHHPNKLELWEEYLSYKETDLTQLSFSSVQAAYRKCFATLFGFHRGTFRSHTFDGDISYALIRVAGRFVKLLLNMGYEERAQSFHVSLLELSTSNKSQADYLKWWDSNCVLLGSKGYVDWWSKNVTSEVTEEISNVSEISDIWSSWLMEEKRKENLCSVPISRSVSRDLVDKECCVTSSWLNHFVFLSSQPEQLFETLFRCYLPEHLNKLPLIALFHCDIFMESRVIEFLIQLCEQLYPRYNNQNTVGVIWTLLNHVKSRNGKATAKFVKGLLKSPSHRNNMVYWSLFIHFSSDGNGVISKLLSTHLSTYHSTYLENQMAICQDTDSRQGVDSKWSAESVRRQIEEIICKPIPCTSETLHLGSHVTHLFCKNYTADPSPSALVDFVSKLSTSETTSDQCLADLFTLFKHILMWEVKSVPTGDTSSLRKVALLAVEQFPQITWFWKVLSDNISLTPKVWDRLLKSPEETLSWRRVSVECGKQEQNTDINLSHRILSVASNAVDTFPRSTLLWEQYLSVTKKYDKKSLKSVLIRSIKENPARKKFYLQAIDLCPEEAETVYELIEEKEIRLRTLIEEIHMFSLGL